MLPTTLDRLRFSFLAIMRKSTIRILLSNVSLVREVFLSGNVFSRGSGIAEQVPTAFMMTTARVPISRGVLDIMNDPVLSREYKRQG
jgi:hypothetical protein